MNNKTFYAVFTPTSSEILFKSMYLSECEKWVDYNIAEYKILFCYFWDGTAWEQKF